jgi:hypothetical protein
VSEQLISIESLLGHSRIEMRYVFHDGQMHTESRRIDYDRHGGKSKVGDWTDCGGSIGWSDGRPFTPADFRHLTRRTYEPARWSRHGIWIQGRWHYPRWYRALQAVGFCLAAGALAWVLHR